MRVPFVGRQRSRQERREVLPLFGWQGAAPGAGQVCRASKAPRSARHERRGSKFRRRRRAAADAPTTMSISGPGLFAPVRTVRSIRSRSSSCTAGWPVQVGALVPAGIRDHQAVGGRCSRASRSNWRSSLLASRSPACGVRESMRSSPSRSTWRGKPPLVEPEQAHDPVGHRPCGTSVQTVQVRWCRSSRWSASPGADRLQDGPDVVAGEGADRAHHSLALTVASPTSSSTSVVQLSPLPRIARRGGRECIGDVGEGCGPGLELAAGAARKDRAASWRRSRTFRPAARPDRYRRCPRRRGAGLHRNGVAPRRPWPPLAEFGPARPARCWPRGRPSWNVARWVRRRSPIGHPKAPSTHSWMRVRSSSSRWKRRRTGSRPAKSRT